MLQLCRIVFDVRYPLEFRLFDKRGEISVFLQEKKILSKVTIEGDVNIIAREEDEKSYSTLGMTTTKIAGSIERKSLHIEDCMPLLGLGESLVTKFVKPSTFQYVGARFYFVEERDEFEKARDIVKKLTDESILNCLGGSLDDVMHVWEMKKSPNIIRYIVGPFRKEELGKWFEKPKKMSLSTGILFDADHHTREYQGTLRLRKYFEAAYREVKKRIGSLYDKIGGEEMRKD